MTTPAKNCLIAISLFVSNFIVDILALKFIIGGINYKAATSSRHENNSIALSLLLIAILIVSIFFTVSRLRKDIRIKADIGSDIYRIISSLAVAAMVFFILIFMLMIVIMIF